MLLVEDLHWLDGSSDAFLHRLIPALADAPVLAGAQLPPRVRPCAGCAIRAYRQIALQPLAEADASALLDELLGRDPSLGDLGRPPATPAPPAIRSSSRSSCSRSSQSGALAGAKGAYHLARTVDAAAIPTSVQAVLAARIDRLPARDKEVLQTAAVIGKQFDSDVLRAVSELPSTELDGALQALAAAELVVEQTARAPPPSMPSNTRSLRRSPTPRSWRRAARSCTPRRRARWSPPAAHRASARR